MKRRHISLFLTAILLVTACGPGNGRYGRLLAEAEWMNRNDSLFTTDSVMKRLVRHYDHWWYSRNTRMRAYYMLGCAYRDMGEAPAALHYYNTAVEQADTAHADSATCATLFRIYGQMAVIYGQQNLPREHLRACENYSRYALLAGDTLNYILGIEHTADSYYNMDDTVSTMRITDDVHRLYLQYGSREKAARVYPAAIYVSILNGDYPRARRYMDIFENESGLFDQGGEHSFWARALLLQ